MPLTFAHPAAVLPGYRYRHRGLPFIPLVIGSMSPDFEYFLRLEPRGNYAHTLSGIFVFCLPAGLIALGLFVAFVEPVLLRALPRGLQARLPAPRSPIPRNWLRRSLGVSSAIVIGAMTHVLWDGFTHQHGFVVNYWPVLRESFGGIPVYKVLQHGSTLLGLLVIGCWIYRQPCESPPVVHGYRCLHYLCAVVLLVLWFLLLATVKTPSNLGILVVQTIDAGLLTVISLGVWLRVSGAADRTSHGR